MEAEEGPSGSARAGVPKAWVGAQEESEGALRRGRHQGHVALGSPDPELGGVSRAAPGCLRGRGAQRPCCQKTRQQASTHPGIKRPVSHARSVTRRSSRWPCSLAALQGLAGRRPNQGPQAGRAPEAAQATAAAFCSREPNPGVWGTHDPRPVPSPYPPTCQHQTSGRPREERARPSG